MLRCDNCKTPIPDESEDYQCNFCAKMANKAMARKFQKGGCIDVSRFERKDGDYILPDFVDDVDYADAVHEFWIGSIGKHLKTGEIRASTSNKFYQNPEYECLWLR